MARILFVEDDLALARMFVLFAEDEEHEVVAAQSLEQGLLELGNGQFDLILQDSFAANPSQFYDAPHLFLEMAQHPPVVVVTGHALDPERLQALGYAGIVKKPFDLDELGRMLKTLLDH